MMTGGPHLSRGRWVRVAALALSAGVAAAGLTFALSAPNTTHAATDTSPAQEGYGLVTITITPPSTPPRTWRVWQADTTAKIERGLMGVTSLGGYPGMLFQFARPVALAFWMRSTGIALSIAFFNADGTMQTRTVDMAPCADSDQCPQYTASAPYLFALEVPRGRLPALGLVNGSRIEVSAR
jgi:uncharacterized protein